MPVEYRNVQPAYLREGGRPGVLTPDELRLSQNGVTLTANQAYANRFYLADPLSVVSIAYVLNTAAGSNDNVDVGIYDSAGNRLASSGATAGKLNTGSFVVVSVSLSVNLPGNSVYFAALSCGAVGTTAAVLQGVTNNVGVMGQIWGASDTDMMMGSKSSVHPLPTTLTAKTASGSNPLIAVRAI